VRFKQAVAIAAMKVPRSQGRSGIGEAAAAYSSGFSNCKAAGEFRIAAGWLKSAGLTRAREGGGAYENARSAYENAKKARFDAKKASRKS
jgi:hypothetical protein